MKGERGFFGGKGVEVWWKEQKKKERDEKMREKVDEISNERGESVWRVCGDGKRWE